MCYPLVNFKQKKKNSGRERRDEGHAEDAEKILNLLLISTQRSLRFSLCNLCVKKKKISRRGRGDEEYAEDAKKSFEFANDFLSAIFALFALRSLREKRRRIHAEGAEMKNTRRAQRKF